MTDKQSKELISLLREIKELLESININTDDISYVKDHASKIEKSLKK